MWRKSSYSLDAGNCVEWRKSSRSGPYSDNCVEFRTSTRSMENGACVEFAGCDCTGPHVALVRDSKDPDGPVLAFDGPPWMRFLHWAPTISGARPTE